MKRKLPFGFSPGIRAEDPVPIKQVEAGDRIKLTPAHLVFLYTKLESRNIAGVTGTRSARRWP